MSLHKLQINKSKWNLLSSLSRVHIGFGGLSGDCSCVCTFRHSIWINDFICSRSIGQRAEHNTWKWTVQICVDTPARSVYLRIRFDVLRAWRSMPFYLIFPSEIRKIKMSTIWSYSNKFEHMFLRCDWKHWKWSVDDTFSIATWRKSIPLNTQL